LVRYRFGVSVSVAAIVLAVAGVKFAGAATHGLRVIGNGHSSGEFAVTAASGHKSDAHALYLRGYGRGLSGMGVVACSKGIASIGSKSTQLGSMRSGRLYRLQMPFRGDCDVTASLSGSGTIRLQILAS
jgi:hypothetical protein